MRPACLTATAALILAIPARAESQWLPLIPGDTTPTHFIWSGDVRRVGPGRVAAWLKWTERANANPTVIMLEEFDCRASTSRVLAMDVYFPQERRSSRQASTEWTPASVPMVQAACQDARVQAADGRAADMVAVAPEPRWRYVGTGGKGESADTLYLDARTFVKRPGGALGWFKAVHTTPETEWLRGIAYDMLQWEFDCVGGRMRAVGGARYDALGKMVRQNRPNPRAEWATPVPDTIGEILLHQLCNAHPIPPAPTGQVGPNPD